MKSELVFNQPYWLILACLLTGVAYSWLLYSKKTSLSKNANYVLAAGRALLVALICFLLINPLLKSNSTKTIKPLLVLGIDNSGSINTIGESAVKSVKERVKGFYDSLLGSDFDIEVRDLDGASVNLDSLSFRTKKTDLGSFFKKVTEEFEGQNLRKVVLLSDGIANSGISPLNRPYTFEIDAIGVGDTTIKKDVSLKGIRSNKLAYLGNSFPIEAELSGKLFAGKSTLVLVKQEDDIVARQLVSFASDDDFKVVNFQLSANKVGKQRYQIEAVPLAGEYTTRNNFRDVIIDVIDGKEKVLLLANAPHPDVKALRAIIEKNELFEVVVKNIQFDSPAEIENTVFDILLLHQLPSQASSSNSLVIKLLGKMKPTFFVLGAQTNLSVFNGMQEVLGISSSSGKTDKVTASFNPLFKRFLVNQDTKQTIASFPPLIAPFGEYRVFPGSDIVLFQQVGNLVTERPMLVVNTNANRKTAVLTSEGIWQWRLEEYFMNEQQEDIDDVILKTMQLISVKEDKEKLRVYPVQDVFDIDESVVFQTEAYDDLYERLNDISVTLQISSSGGFSKTYNYTAGVNTSTFEITQLKAGVYNYRATGVVLGKNQISEGQFIVRDTDLEFVNTTADFNLLRSLASDNGGNFVPLAEMDRLAELIKGENLPSRLVSTEDLQEIINLKWLLPLLLLLAALEWGFRKYFGSY